MTILNPFSSSRRLGSRDLRLASGLAMGAFILCHFVNHAFGLISVEAMEAARPFLSAPWRTPPGTVLLYGSVALHFALTLRTLYSRRTLRMPMREIGQTVLGLALPFMLIGHVTATRIEFALTDTVATYPAMVENYWVRNPSIGGRQIAALLVAWLHVCLGLYFWLRVKRGFPAWRPFLFAAAILVPVLSILGFTEAGKEVSGRDRILEDRTNRVPDWIGPALELSFAVPIGLVLAARGVRGAYRRRDRVRIGYPDGRFVEVPKGFSILEASRSGRIAHQAVCGGRARCSTCRVEIVRGGHGQPAPSDLERNTLERIGGGDNVRLACQFRPVRDIDIVPLVNPSIAPGEALRSGRRASYGEEREIVVLFCDIRGFTSLAEHRLPYDVVFILNRYFDLVGRAVTESGGLVDKFVGDGAMALFGVSSSPGEAAAQGLAAAEKILAGLDAVNDLLGHEVREGLRIAIALHRGPAIVGEIGYGSAASLTAVGDTINVASRLEGLAKTADAELVVSDAVMRSAGMTPQGFEAMVLPLRGRSRPLEVWIRRPLAAHARSR
ncbi:adenylate/guanylate cyclase domain-containing protein [Aureimonas psammosilenae]|uniref:adenylate/guanylate cyclase domain-containing protein n=1 Tax=Aureimonas psammosilenae TaxID=2495496 RepID=UPI001260D8AF|nr:adenylate/guanylate cyclase domain-containing protein [Aureimonas psammosilenae]